MKYVAVLLMLTSLVIAGCGSSSTTLGNPYIGGSEAVTIGFVRGAPPSEVFDEGEDPFSVQVEIENMGEHNMEATGGYIYLRGINPAEYGVTDSQLRVNLPALRGATKDSNGRVLLGDKEIIMFDEMKYVGDIAATIDSTVIEAVACYDYSTRATGTICVKKSNRDQDNDICKLAEPKQIANSGGPVQVSALEQRPAGDKIQLSFVVGSASKGSNEFFFKKGTECNTLPSNRDRYVVFVEVKPILNGGVQPTCSGLEGGNSGYITLADGGSRPVSCTYDVSGVRVDATTQFNVELSYRYQESIRTPLVIKDQGNNERE
jgi:hypothetical protein